MGFGFGSGSGYLAQADDHVERRRQQSPPRVHGRLAPGQLGQQLVHALVQVDLTEQDPGSGEGWGQGQD